MSLNRMLSKLRKTLKYPVTYSRTKRYHITSSSTTPWPTSKIVNELVHSILHVVNCVLCLFYIVWFILYHRHVLFIFILPYILTIQLLRCRSYSKPLSCLEQDRAKKTLIVSVGTFTRKLKVMSSSKNVIIMYWSIMYIENVVGDDYYCSWCAQIATSLHLFRRSKFQLPAACEFQSYTGIHSVPI